MTDTPATARMSRNEIYIAIAIAALVVGLFDWTGIVYLEKNGQARWQKSQAMRKIEVVNQTAICAALKITCTPPKAD